MPNLDGTGPIGKGQMTGKRMGKCKNAFARKKQIRHETGEPHTDRVNLENKPVADVFVRQKQK